MPNPDSHALIAKVQDLAERLDRRDLLDDLAEIDLRLRASLLSVALIGQFKRGKTSLLNALLGDEVLPTGVLPLTAVVNRIRWGPHLRVTVHFLDGSEREIPRDELRVYATELGNPRNALAVRDILILYPSPLLAQGIELVDTPGIGSVWTHNTEVATGYLPWVDVALFIVSPDPPITDVERQFLQEARKHAGKIVVVLSKADLLSAHDLETVRTFVEEVVEGALEAKVPVWRTSVCQGAHTGIEDVAAHLAELAGSDREVLATRMAHRRVLGVLHRLRFDLELQRAAMMTPLELRAERRTVLQRQLAAFDATLATYAGAWQSAFQRVTQVYDDRLAQRKGPILATLGSRVEQRLGSGAHPRTVYLSTAEDVDECARGLLETLRDDLRLITRDVLEAEARPLMERIQDWIGQFSQTAADLFDLPAVAVDLPVEIRESRGFTFKWQDDPSILPTLGPRLRGDAAAEAGCRCRQTLPRSAHGRVR